MFGAQISRVNTTQSQMAVGMRGATTLSNAPTRELLQATEMPHCPRVPQLWLH